MWVQTSEGQALIRELSKTVVTETVQVEMDLFEELVEGYFQHPVPPEPSAQLRDDPLGFGLDEVLIAVTPAAAAMVSAVLNHLGTEFIHVAKDESAEVVKKRVKELFQKKKKSDKLVKKVDKGVRPLNKEQLEQVKKLARNEAIRFGVSKDKAEKMANALVGKLALAK
jgi:hypothetical protein